MGEGPGVGVGGGWGGGQLAGRERKKYPFRRILRNLSFLRYLSCKTGTFEAKVTGMTKTVFNSFA